MMKNRLSARAIPVQLPIDEAENYGGLIDLVKMKAVIIDGRFTKQKDNYKG
jgi:translation elongation factor EF-G